MEDIQGFLSPTHEEVSLLMDTSQPDLVPHDERTPLREITHNDTQKNSGNTLSGRREYNPSISPLNNSLLDELVLGNMDSPMFLRSASKNTNLLHTFMDSPLAFEKRNINAAGSSKINVLSPLTDSPLVISKEDFLLVDDTLLESPILKQNEPLNNAEEDEELSSQEAMPAVYIADDILVTNLSSSQGGLMNETFSPTKLQSSVGAEIIPLPEVDKGDQSQLDSTFVMEAEPKTSDNVADEDKALSALFAVPSDSSHDGVELRPSLPTENVVSDQPIVDVSDEKVLNSQGPAECHNMVKSDIADCDGDTKTHFTQKTSSPLASGDQKLESPIPKALLELSPLCLAESEKSTTSDSKLVLNSPQVLPNFSASQTGENETALSDNPLLLMKIDDDLPAPLPKLKEELKVSESNSSPSSKTSEPCDDSKCSSSIKSDESLSRSPEDLLSVAKSTLNVNHTDQPASNNPITVSKDGTEEKIPQTSTCVKNPEESKTKKSKPSLLSRDRKVPSLSRRSVSSQETVAKAGQQSAVTEPSARIQDKKDNAMRRSSNSGLPRKTGLPVKGSKISVRKSSSNLPSMLGKPTAATSRPAQPKTAIEPPADLGKTVVRKSFAESKLQQNAKTITKTSIKAPVLKRNSLLPNPGKTVVRPSLGSQLPNQPSIASGPKPTLGMGTVTKDIGSKRGPLKATLPLKAMSNNVSQLSGRRRNSEIGGDVQPVTDAKRTITKSTSIATMEATPQSTPLKKSDVVVAPKNLNEVFATPKKQSALAKPMTTKLPTPRRTSSSSSNSSNNSFRKPGSLSSSFGSRHGSDKSDDMDPFKPHHRLVQNTPDQEPRRLSMWSPVPRNKGVPDDERVYLCTKRPRPGPHAAVTDKA